MQAFCEERHLEEAQEQESSRDSSCAVSLAPGLHFGRQDWSSAAARCSNTEQWEDLTTCPETTGCHRQATTTKLWFAANATPTVYGTDGKSCVSLSPNQHQNAWAGSLIFFFLISKPLKGAVGSWSASHWGTGGLEIIHWKKVMLPQLTTGLLDLCGSKSGSKNSCMGDLGDN